MEGKAPEVRRGHVTGSGRKLKDNAADWHNLALKWDRLNDAGSTYATNIVNFTLQKESGKEASLLASSGGAADAPPVQGLNPSSRELEEECVKLQDVVEKMTRVLSKMEKMASSDQGICALETFQFGDEGRPTPLFHTWSTPHFAAVSSRLCESYRQELSLKRLILQEVAHTSDPQLAMVYLSSWLHQPYTGDGDRLLLEGLLLETGHRPL
ncbi:cyclin-dependent kinase 2-interacting protein-like [Denticeps clupeoides]|uniref:Cyclin-dependent kinase 2-interacting protein n=1 Tax=Denticeps clupeoides TaxID=299321 RepID=A0AAY3ZXE5_9TELE|nr:cyclin-dependent kinase 2-interacting protein-like [Denticeps clupeoides]